jgi:hypothetical protein
VFNGRIDAKPAAVFYAKSAGQVSAAVKYVTRHISP